MEAAGPSFIAGMKGVGGPYVVDVWGREYPG